MKMNSVQKARTQLLLTQPFYGSLLMSLSLIETDQIPTAATDMEKIYYNPQFFATLDIEEVKFVLVHEVLHVALCHGLRLQSRQHRLWNMACDYAINLMLRNASFKLVRGCLIDNKYADMSSEHIYDTLLQDADSRQKASSADDDNPLGSDVQAPANQDPTEIAATRQRITQRVAQAANVARMAGKMSADVERLVGEVLNPQLPWRDLLRNYMLQVVRSDESWSRRNRRFNAVYLPSRHTERMGEIVVIGDSSGSITAAEFGHIATEVQSIADMIQPECIRVVWADTEVKLEEVFEAGEPITIHPMGGGGTDMRVPLQYVEQYLPTVVILITDGYTPWPPCEPDYPLIVVCTTNQKVPIGNVVTVSGRS